MNDEESDFIGPFYEYGDDGEEVVVSGRCPDCRKFIKFGIVLSVKNRFGELDHYEFNNFVCKTHGEVKPIWYWKADVTE